ncbi:MAG: hypothetical protein CMI53_04910 [Parcubacteria group bacterium]|nr:hypothetical protein [Parcubacteria group bacterium]
MHNRTVSAMIRLDTLYKERLFVAEWMLLYTLSLIIALSVLFINTENLFFQMVVLIFPAVISLALFIINYLDKLAWSRESVTLEPNQRLFDAIGKKRFYLKRNIKYLKKSTKRYRTEDELTDELQKIHSDILNKRKSQS